MGEKDSPGVPGDHNNPLPVPQQCVECGYIWEYDKTIKACPKCGIEFV